MYSLLTLLFWLLLGGLCARMAKKRGRRPVIWFVLGVLLGVIGVAILYILPSKAIVADQDPPPLQAIITPEEEEPKFEKQKLWYYLDQDHKQYGPMSFDALQQAWGKKEISKTTYVWNEEMENWKRLEALPPILSQMNLPNI